LPVNICVVALLIVEVLCRDVNQSEITMANNKPAVRTPNVRPLKYGDFDEQYCDNLYKDFDLQNGNIIFSFKLI
jgi:hypothetical protein